tara:strand:- start:950 stop:1219 length:270 start_codon:yes stop_codon:yes gene_type:complete
MESIYTVIITAITVLGSTSAWRFYEKKMDNKKEDEFEFKYDCRARIDKLELLLSQSSLEKDELRKTILELSTQLAALGAKVELMEKKKR